MSRLQLKVAFADSCEPRPGIEQGYQFLNLLRQRYDVTISDNPDLLLCSVFTSAAEHLRYDCMKCLINEEHPRSSHDLCDYSLTTLPTGGRNFHFLAFSIYDGFQAWLQGKSDTLQALTAHPKTRFCAFIYSNSEPKERQQFCQQLMAHKVVDCPGAVLSNMPPFTEDVNLTRYMNKMRFLKSYRFTICFENRSHPRYMTEKLPNALMVGSIPIYWGCPLAGEYFNPARFINCHDYDSFDAVIERVLEIEHDPALYRQYTEPPAVLPDSMLYAMTPDNILDFIEPIAARIKCGSPHRFPAPQVDENG